MPFSAGSGRVDGDAATGHEGRQPDWAEKDPLARRGAAARRLAVVVFAVAVTRGVSWRARFPITRAWLSEPDHLRLVVNTCGGHPELDLLREQTQVVVVAVVSTRTFGGPGGMDCQDLVEVQLQEPLGDRRLVDATTGDEIAVEPG